MALDGVTFFAPKCTKYIRMPFLQSKSLVVGGLHVMAENWKYLKDKLSVWSFPLCLNRNRFANK